MAATQQVFLSYAEHNRESVETLAARLRGDARLSFWFQPWNSVPGRPVQEQMEDALLAAQACAIFIGGDAPALSSWQNEQMRAAIQNRVEDDGSYRVIPLLLPGAARPQRRRRPGATLSPAFMTAVRSVRVAWMAGTRPNRTPLPIATIRLKSSARRSS